MASLTSRTFHLRAPAFMGAHCMPGSLTFGAPPPTPQRRQPRWLDLTVFFAVRFLPGSRKWSPRQAAVGRPGSPKTCPCGASCVLHPPCSVTGRPPGTRPACPPNGVSFTTVVRWFSVQRPATNVSALPPPGQAPGPSHLPFGGQGLVSSGLRSAGGSQRDLGGLEDG